MCCTAKRLQDYEMECQQINFNFSLQMENLSTLTIYLGILTKDFNNVDGLDDEGG